MSENLCRVKLRDLIRHKNRLSTEHISCILPKASNYLYNGDTLDIFERYKTCHETESTLHKHLELRNITDQDCLWFDKEQMREIDTVLE